MKRNLTDSLVAKLKPPAGGRLEVFDQQLPGFGVRIGTSGRRAFFVMYRAHGKLVRETLGTYPALSLKDARRQAAKSMEIANGGEDPRAERRERLRSGFDATAMEFIHRYAEIHQKPKTLIETKRYINRYLIPAWGTSSLQRIRRADILRLLDSLVDDGKSISANRMLATTRKLFNWCIERGYLEVSPATGIRPPGKEQSRTRVLTAMELGAIWRAADTLGYPFGSFLQMMVATGGQRLSDVARMRRSEIHEDAWRLKGPTKSEEPHSVPLSSLALEILIASPRFAGDYVFSTTAGDKPIAALSQAKLKIDALSGVTNWRYHDIRRTVATVFGEILAQPPHVAEAVQNRKSGTIKGVMAVYNRARYEQDKRTALEAWATYVRGTLVENVVRISPDSPQIKAPQSAPPAKR